MERRAKESQSEDWIEEDEDENAMTEDFEDAEERFEQEIPKRALLPAGPQRLLARRLIEQAREKRELSKCLADFDDYLV